MLSYWTVSLCSCFCVMLVPWVGKLHNYGKLTHLLQSSTARISSMSNNSPKLKRGMDEHENNRGMQVYSMVSLLKNIEGWTVSKRYFLHFYVVGAVTNGFLALSVADLIRRLARGENSDYTVLAILRMRVNDLTALSYLWSNVLPSTTHAVLQTASETMYNLAADKLSCEPEQSLSYLENGMTLWACFACQLMLQLHILQRLYEECCLFHKSSARMHVFGYLIGTSFYIAAPFTTMIAFLKLSTSSSVQDADFHHERSWFLQALIVCFMIAFLITTFAQHQHHRILACLRGARTEDKKEAEDAERYKIPNGGIFKYVSCPHYFLEVVLYLLMVTFFIAASHDCSTQASCFYLPMDTNLWLMFSFVLCNLSITAMKTHQWYLSRFAEYPQQRKAIIPFLF